MLSSFREVQKTNTKSGNLWEIEKIQGKERLILQLNSPIKGPINMRMKLQHWPPFFSAFHRSYCMYCTVLENTISFFSQAPLTRTVLPAFRLFSSLPIFLPFSTPSEYCLKICKGLSRGEGLQTEAHNKGK